MITLPGSGTVGRAKLAPFVLRKVDNAMPFQAAPNIAQVRVEGTVDSQLTINDLYFELSGGGITPVNLATLVTAVGDWACSNLAPNLSEDWFCDRASGIDLGSADGAAFSIPVGCAGGVTSEAAPNNVAACISIRTASRGRSGHGRNFVPAVPNAAITLNTMSIGFMGGIVSAYSLLVGAGTFEAGWQMVVLSRVSGGALRTPPLAFPVTSVLFTSASVRSMRSREIGHGA